MKKSGGPEARSAITGITRVAGFANTVGWPLSAVFIHFFGWRGACLGGACLHLAVDLPMKHLLVPKPAMPAVIPSPCAAQAVPEQVSMAMAVLAGVFAAASFVSTAYATHMPRLLEALGLASAAAVFAASLIHPGAGLRPALYAPE